jgi:hypothetical protein
MVIVPIIKIIETVNWKTRRKFFRMLIHPASVGFFPFRTRPGAKRDIYIAGSNPVNNDPDTRRKIKSSKTIR